MNVLSPAMIVLAHPRAGSVDHQLAAKARSVLTQVGVRQAFHDLYAESFDPVLTAGEAIAGEVWTRGTSSDQVRGERAEAPAAEQDPLLQRHRQELAETKALVVIHPDWLGKPPAIFTGWLDRVLLASTDATEELERVLVINTCEQPPSPDRVGSDPLGLLWREQIGPFLGSPKFERLTFGPSGSQDQELRTRWLNAVERATGWACGAAR